MGKVINLPVKKKPPKIDWEAIEEERRKIYPRISKKAVSVLQQIIESKSTESHMTIDDGGHKYPPEVIKVPPRESAVKWVLDLLDRFGGTLAGTKLQSTIRRTKKRLPVFMIIEISRETHTTLTAALGGEFEHFVRSDDWQMLGKELVGTDLIALLISSRKDDGKDYFGLFDRRTILVLMRRLGEELSIDDLIEWGL